LRCELPACLYDLGAVDDLERFAAQRARAQAITATTLKRVLGHINVSPGLTQAQTARDLGLSRRTVQRVLNSQRSTP
jgi:AraC-like DNA-binding protein